MQAKAIMRWLRREARKVRGRRTLCAASLALLLVSLGCGTGADRAKGVEEDASQPEVVVLLHGLGRTDRSMRPLEKRLAEAGFEVHNLRYASTDKPPEALVEELGREVESCCTQAPAVHFVGHSLGGLIARAYVAEEAPANVGRVVMLAAPNRGSELVDEWGESALFRSALGPAAQQLGTDPESFPNRLPPPVVEIGVIAGTGSVNPIGSAVIPDEDDGMVSLASTRLEGMKDFLVVPTSHAFIMRSEEVGVQVVHFLRHGLFQGTKRQAAVSGKDTASSATP